MITLFRRIREKLIGEGNVSRYLIYAVGEILLVVIGILIALQINNWNDNKSLKAQEKIYLQQIREDLVLQLGENETQRSVMTTDTDIEAQLTALIKQKFDVEEDQRDRAKSLLLTIPTGRTYGAYEATFTDLTSSGNIGLISNPQLKNLIIRHYQVQKRDRDVINNNTRNNFLDMWSKLVDRNIIAFSSTINEYYNENDLSVIEFDPALAFMDDALFENLSKEENLLLLQNVMVFKVTTSEFATGFIDESNERIHRLIDQIDEELEIL